MNTKQIALIFAVSVAVGGIVTYSGGSPAPGPADSTVAADTFAKAYAAATDAIGVTNTPDNDEDIAPGPMLAPTPAAEEATSAENSEVEDSGTLPDILTPEDSVLTSDDPQDDAVLRPYLGSDEEMDVLGASGVDELTAVASAFSGLSPLSLLDLLKKAQGEWVPVHDYAEMKIPANMQMTLTGNALKFSGGGPQMRFRFLRIPIAVQQISWADGYLEIDLSRLPNIFIPLG